MKLSIKRNNLRSNYKNNDIDLAIPFAKLEQEQALSLMELIYMFTDLDTDEVPESK